MNSYPSELLTQLGPVMFIAGLDATADPPHSDTETSEDDRILGKRLQADPFLALVKRLRDVLFEKSIKKGTVWVGDAERAAPGFRMLLVDKNVRFPPQKATGPEAHSPLSPFTQTSPLHPDGLIAPIWVRKHTELLPSVFVLFLRLFEPPSRPPPSPISPLHNQFTSEKEEEKRREEERKRDAELSAEIAIRKRACSERGVKLTVVLMASRKMLDDPNLDSRLTYIRRQSGLDSRAALFVLSPVSPSELQEFVKSLQSALHDAALEYYLNHSKRVRRKRNRQVGSIASGISIHSHTGTFATPTSAAFPSRAPVQPLRPQGWIVRYEYKMACFAEFRGEEEVARKHFQTSWETLLDMFGSTAILPPRTKRWAEAKVLADCISLKIIKLYLYRAEHSRAMAHFNAHLTRFADFSRGWGIGEETWEFWSWIARWYRILAELLDMATLSTLSIPKHLPTFPIAPLTPGPPASYQQPQHLSLEPPRPVGANPSSVLQHPGFYYYAAATCTQRRLEQFVLTDQESRHANGVVPTNLANERKVDHRVIILELYTKAYELFKKHSYGQGQSRLTFYIACRIAQTYHDSGKFDMAVRFFERIAKTYRKERWAMLKPILSMWYTCARQMGDVDGTVKLLIEMMCCGAPDDFESGQLEEDLAAVLQSTSPAATPFKIDFDSYTLFQSQMVFWQSEVDISTAAPFQLHLRAPPSTSVAALPFVSLQIEFSDRRTPVIIRHSAPLQSAELKSLQLVDLGFVPFQSEGVRPEVQANLRWPLGGTLVLAGSLASHTSTTLGILNVTLHVLEGNWSIELANTPSPSKDLKYSQAQWLSCLDPPTFLPIQAENPSTITVRHRPHLINISLSHSAPAYLDEEYPIIMTITNIDDHDLDVVVDVLLQPVEDAVNHISLENDRSTGLIKGVSHGCLTPGQVVAKTLLLHNTGVSGDRTIDVSVQCETPNSGAGVDNDVASPVSPHPSADVSETLHTLVIPTFSALETESLASYRRPTRLSTDPPLASADLDSYEASTLDTQAEVVLRTTVVSRGPQDVTIENLTFLPANENEQVKLLSCSLDGERDDFPLHCQAGDVYSVISRFVVFGQDDEIKGSQNPSPPGAYEVTWRRAGSSGQQGTRAVTQISLPPLSVPQDSLDALLELQAAGVLHVPITATLIVRNRHPWRTADLHLQLEPSDHFVLSGLRSGSLPVLLAGGEERLAFNLIPISCGTVRLPTFRLLDRRKETRGSQIGEGHEAEKIPVIDSRLEERNETGEEIRLMVYLSGEGSVTRLRRVDAEGLSLFITPSS
ncbi:hypothetical protein K439DRAFT_1633686 [Ramaria rubella]|nr:hypothetical protein K439DRAFT_1633686 [Ramaria rubella]